MVGGESIAVLERLGDRLCAWLRAVHPHFPALCKHRDSRATQRAAYLHRVHVLVNDPRGEFEIPQGEFEPDNPGVIWDGE